MSWNAGRLLCRVGRLLLVLGERGECHRGAAARGLLEARRPASRTDQLLITEDQLLDRQFHLLSVSAFQGNLPVGELDELGFHGESSVAGSPCAPFRFFFQTLLLLFALPCHFVPLLSQEPLPLLF